MEKFRIAFSLIILSFLSACSEKVDEATLESIEARLSAIENIDARITSASNEKNLIEIELREFQEAIERIETRHREAISRAREKLDRTKYDAGESLGHVDIDRFIEEFRELAEENTKLKDELEQLRSNSKD